MASKRTATKARPIAQSRDETAKLITALGNTQRERIRLKTEMDDQIATITDAYAPDLAKLDASIKDALEQIQGWCEANRHDLLADGGKSANLTTGDVGWRQDPPSVTVRDPEAVLEALDNLGLDAWIRTKREVAKEAILADRSLTLGTTTTSDEEAEAAAEAAARLAKIAEIPGLSINAGREKFWVTPAELAADPV